MYILLYNIHILQIEHIANWIKFCIQMDTACKSKNTL